MSPTQLYAIGQRIRNRRRQLNYTQEQLAEMMDVSVQMVSNLERGNKAIKIENLIHLSKILNTSTDYILMGIGENDTAALPDKYNLLQEEDRMLVNLLIERCAQK